MAAEAGTVQPTTAPTMMAITAHLMAAIGGRTTAFITMMVTATIATAVITSAIMHIEDFIICIGGALLTGMLSLDTTLSKATQVRWSTLVVVTTTTRQIWAVIVIRTVKGLSTGIRTVSRDVVIAFTSGINPLSMPDIIAILVFDFGVRQTTNVLRIAVRRRRRTAWGR